MPSDQNVGLVNEFRDTTRTGIDAFNALTLPQEAVDFLHLAE